MATVKHNLTATPVRISDGTKKVYAQSLDGLNFKYVQSTASPDKSVFHLGREVSIGEGFSIWAWNPTTMPITLIVSTAE